jgi:hypothetical protein
MKKYLFQLVHDGFYWKSAVARSVIQTVHMENKPAYRFMGK